MSRGDSSGRSSTGRDQGRNDSHPRSLSDLPVDALERICHYLDARDVLALSRSCSYLRHVASTPGVWADLVLRTFSREELPQDLGFLTSRNTQLLTAQFRQLALQRPAFLSHAPRTSEILEHAGSRFRKVLHIDGRRDLNFTTVFRNVPPDHYTVVWRLMLQPGYVRGYCNFRAVFARPAADAKGGRSAAKARRAASLLPFSRPKKPASRSTDPQAPTARAAEALGREPGGPSGLGYPPVGPRGAHPPPQPPKWRLRRRLRWLPTCLGEPTSVAPEEEEDLFPDEPGPASGPVAAAVAGGGLGQGYVDPHHHQQPQLHQQHRGGEGAPSRSAGAQGDLPGAGVLLGSQGVRPTPPAAPPQLLAPGGQQRLEVSPNHYPQEPRPPEQRQQQQQQAPPLQQQQAQQQAHPEIEPLPAPVPQLQPQPLPQQPQRPAPQPAARDPVPNPVPNPAPHPAQLAAEQHVQQVQLQRAMGQLATASAKRDAALANSIGGGSRYVPRWLAPLWGGHDCAWRQLDPAGPLGQGAWRGLHMGTVTVRRRADVHLHSVMVQLRPINAAQAAAAMPPGETRWRGALVDYVELVPTRQPGLLEGLLPGFARSNAPVVPSPELPDLVAVPKV